MKLLDLLFGKREVDVIGNTNNQEVMQTQPVRNSGEFELVIEDVFSIMGRGTVVTGVVNKGVLKLNDEVTIVRTGMRTVVTGIEQFRKTCDFAQEGEHYGIMLQGVAREDVQRGDVLIK